MQFGGADPLAAYTLPTVTPTEASSPRSPLTGGVQSEKCGASGKDDEVLNSEIKAVPPAILTEAFEACAQEDAGVEAEARQAYADEVERNQRSRALRAAAQSGLVNRRAPLNPFASHKLGKYRAKTPGAKEGLKVADPALRNNPIYGKLLMCLCSNAILMFIFFQSLLANKILEGSFYAPTTENKMVGPSGVTLLHLGALNANLIRNDGATFRIFWAMWMHSGWIHILLNVLSQLQNLWMFEPDWGFCRCLFIYCVSGIVGNLTSLLFNPCSTTVGSSGCLFGLMGAMVIYCIEFWETIPRPFCVMVFSVVVAIISLILGFTSGTDNWAHLGGLFGGLCSSLLTTPRFPRKVRFCGGSKKSAEEREQERVAEAARKAKHQRKRVARTLTKWFPCLLWSWKAREAVARILAGACLIAYIAVACVIFFNNFEYQPVGQPTFSSGNKCCCCYAPPTDIVTGIHNTEELAQWQCYVCDSVWLDDGTTYGDYCATPMASSATLGMKGDTAKAHSSLQAALGLDQLDESTLQSATANIFGRPRRVDLAGRLADPLTAVDGRLPGSKQQRGKKSDSSRRRSHSQPATKSDLQHLFDHSLTDVEVRYLLSEAKRSHAQRDVLDRLNAILMQ